MDLSRRTIGILWRYAKRFRAGDSAFTLSPVRAATDEADFKRAPVGAALASRCFVYFCAREDLCGFALWGRPSGEDLEALERVLVIELGEDFPAHVSLVDASRLEGVDPNAFGVLHTYVARNRARLAEQVHRLAIIPPPGVAGATVAGFFYVAEPPYPVEIARDPRAGLAWLGARDDGFLEALGGLVTGAMGAPPFLFSLRRLLDTRPGKVSLEEAARALGLSARSLQRRLREASSTYQLELARSQVRAAEVLLRESNASLTAIAFEVGCATPQHFSALFRRINGESPSAWRMRVKG
jgi:AraC-like DNA-binding protein